ncbi:unnamed protein product [Protopolystoma xenopodis]|uniref:Uncharacterized protein n=1 Tax=Protopolystoma xenopodis TaxID=117903 RepID=A0A448XFS0_9PLAT|nr:unnamed protein product [Protopolystoma xenopodis]
MLVFQFSPGSSGFDLYPAAAAGLHLSRSSPLTMPISLSPTLTGPLSGGPVAQCSLAGGLETDGLNSAVTGALQTASSGLGQTHSPSASSSAGRLHVVASLGAEGPHLQLMQLHPGLSQTGPMYAPVASLRHALGPLELSASGGAFDGLHRPLISLNGVSDDVSGPLGARSASSSSSALGQTRSGNGHYGPIFSGSLHMGPAGQTRSRQSSPMATPGLATVYRGTLQSGPLGADQASSPFYPFNTSQTHPAGYSASGSLQYVSPIYVAVKSEDSHDRLTGHYAQQQQSTSAQTPILPGQRSDQPGLVKSACPTSANVQSMYMGLRAIGSSGGSFGSCSPKLSTSFIDEHRMGDFTASGLSDHGQSKRQPGSTSKQISRSARPVALTVPFTFLPLIPF